LENLTRILDVGNNRKVTIRLIEPRKGPLFYLYKQDPVVGLNIEYCQQNRPIRVLTSILLTDNSPNLSDHLTETWFREVINCFSEYGLLLTEYFDELWSKIRSLAEAWDREHQLAEYVYA
jgi:hypothetical protein